MIAPPEDRVKRPGDLILAAHRGGYPSGSVGVVCAVAVICRKICDVENYDYLRLGFRWGYPEDGPFDRTWFGHVAPACPDVRNPPVGYSRATFGGLPELPG